MVQGQRHRVRQAPLNSDSRDSNTLTVECPRRHTVLIKRQCSADAVVASTLKKRLTVVVEHELTHEAYPAHVHAIGARPKHLR